MGDQKARQVARRAVADKNACTTEEPTAGFQSDSDTAVTAYLDSLLGELPEEAVEDAWQAWLAADVGMKWERDSLAESLPAFLRSLRDSLASGQGQGERHGD